MAQLMRAKKLPKLGEWLSPPKRKETKPPERQQRGPREFMAWFASGYRGGVVKHSENSHGG